MKVPIFVNQAWTSPERAPRCQNFGFRLQGLGLRVWGFRGLDLGCSIYRGLGVSVLGSRDSGV